MNSQPGTKNRPGRLVQAAQTSIESPPALHQETALGSVREAIENHRYVLVTNDLGQITGIVSCRRILERLDSKHERERIRWESMNLGAFVDAEVSTVAQTNTEPFTSEIDCVTVTEDDTLVAIAVKDDVFLSVRRIEPTLAAARCDALTGLMNRLGYERRLAEEWARAARTGISLGVIVLDLDNFKQVNDKYGHLAGDEVLKHVAAALERTLRSYDVIARYGGDEFVVLCLDCKPKDIEIPVKRFQASLAATTVEYGGHEIKVSAAIGAAVRHSDFEDSCVSDLFAAADECVYQSKRTSGVPCVLEFGAGMSADMWSVANRDKTAESSHGNSLIESDNLGQNQEEGARS